MYVAMKLGRCANALSRKPLAQPNGNTMSPTDRILLPEYAVVGANFVSFVTMGTYVSIVKSPPDANLELRANLLDDGVMERTCN
jgi:hypothetical protein